MQQPFTKMHGAGNDFVVIDRLSDDSVPLPDAARRRELADRHTGIGYDQMLVIAAPRREDSDAYIHIYNADGKAAAQCGNGLRCIVRYLADRYGRRDWRLDGIAGPIPAHTEPDGTVSVSVGIPQFGMAATGAQNEPPFTVGDARYPASLVSVGNPHAVIAVDDMATAPVEQVGNALQRYFKDGVNVGFAAQTGPAQIALRVWERGVGETRACGTGAVAAAVTAIKAQEFRELSMAVRLPGGQLMVKWAGPADEVWLRGPAQQVYEGSFTV